MNPEIDYTAWRFWWDLVQTMILAALAVYTWIVNRQRVTRDAIDRVSDRASKLERRMDVMEEAKKNMPSHRDLKDLEKRLDRMSGQIASLVRSDASQEKLLYTIHDHLMNGGNKG